MIKMINIGGKDRPVMYGINALAEFNEATNTTLIWIFQMAENPLSLNFNQLRYLVYVGLCQGARESNIAVDFSVDDVGNWLNSDFGKFPQFMSALTGSLPQSDDTQKKTKPEPGKK
jgi:hypothetical protein